MQKHIMAIGGDKMVKRRRKNKKLIYGIVILVLLIIAGVVTYAVWNAYFNKGVDDGGEQETSEIDQKEEDKKEDKEDDKADGEESGEEVVEIEREKEKESVAAYEGSDPNKSGELTGVLTYAAVSGDYLMIRVNIDQYLGGGSCEIALTKNGGVVYRETANIVSAASTAACEGFNVPVSAVGAGDFRVEIRLNSGDKTGVIKGAVSI